MGSVINRLRIKSLQGQVEASRLHSQALASKFESAATSGEKTRIARLYDEALKKTHAMQLLLELLEREEREKVAGMDAPVLESEAASG